ncbi:hypothetical protein CBS101457_003503 [Exobasidium rhododendri]|nr:hypothetical protein CBS101457_003503 [Exobasidium rhododendri]
MKEASLRGRGLEPSFAEASRASFPSSQSLQLDGNVALSLHTDDNDCTKVVASDLPADISAIILQPFPPLPTLPGEKATSAKKSFIPVFSPRRKTFLGSTIDRAKASTSLTALATPSPRPHPGQHLRRCNKGSLGPPQQFYRKLPIAYRSPSPSQVTSGTPSADGGSRQIQALGRSRASKQYPPPPSLSTSSPSSSHRLLTFGGSEMATVAAVKESDSTTINGSYRNAPLLTKGLLGVAEVASSANASEASKSPLSAYSFQAGTESGWTKEPDVPPGEKLSSSSSAMPAKASANQARSRVESSRGLAKRLSFNDRRKDRSRSTHEEQVCGKQASSGHSFRSDLSSIRDGRVRRQASEEDFLVLDELQQESRSKKGEPILGKHKGEASLPRQGTLNSSPGAREETLRGSKTVPSEERMQMRLAAEMKLSSGTGGSSSRNPMAKKRSVLDQTVASFSQKTCEKSEKRQKQGYAMADQSSRLPNALLLRCQNTPVATRTSCVTPEPTRPPRRSDNAKTTKTPCNSPNLSEHCDTHIEEFMSAGELERHQSSRIQAASDGSLSVKRSKKQREDVKDTRAVLGTGIESSKSDSLRVMPISAPLSPAVSALVPQKASEVKPEAVLDPAAALSVAKTGLMSPALIDESARCRSSSHTTLQELRKTMKDLEDAIASTFDQEDEEEDEDKTPRSSFCSSSHSMYSEQVCSIAPTSPNWSDKSSNSPMAALIAAMSGSVTSEGEKVVVDGGERYADGEEMGSRQVEEYGCAMEGDYSAAPVQYNDVLILSGQDDGLLIAPFDPDGQSLQLQDLKDEGDLPESSAGSVSEEECEEDDLPLIDARKRGGASVSIHGEKATVLKSHFSAEVSVDTRLSSSFEEDKWTVQSADEFHTTARLVRSDTKGEGVQGEARLRDEMVQSHYLRDLPGLTVQRTAVSIAETAIPRSLQVEVKWEGKFDHPLWEGANHTWTGVLALNSGDVEAVGRAWYRSKFSLNGLSFGESNARATLSFSKELELSPTMESLSVEEIVAVERRVMEERHEEMIRSSFRKTNPAARSPFFSTLDDDRRADMMKMSTIPSPSNKFQQRPLHLMARTLSDRPKTCEETLRSDDNTHNPMQLLRSPAQILRRIPSNSSKASRSPVFSASPNRRSPGMMTSSLSELRGYDCCTYLM